MTTQGTQTRAADSNASGAWARAVLCVAAGAALIGLAPIGLRLSEVPPQATAFWRFLFALPVLLVIAAVVRQPIRRPGMLAAAGMAFGAEIGVWHLALTLTTVANATLFSNMTPIVAALAGWLLFQQKISRGFAFGAGVAVSGAVLLSLGRSAGGQGSFVGDALGLLSALGYATYLILLGRARATVHVAPAMLVTTAFAALVALAAALAFGERLLPETWQGWAILVGLGVVVHVGGQGLIALGIGSLPIALSTVLLWVQPVAAAAFAWILFGEALGPLGIVGAVLVLGGLYWVQRSRAA